jgi:hypothetical protein
MTHNDTDTDGVVHAGPDRVSSMGAGEAAGAPEGELR